MANLFSKPPSKKELRFSVGWQSVKYAAASFCYSEMQWLYIYFCVSIFISVVLCPVLVDLWDVPEVATGIYLPWASSARSKHHFGNCTGITS